MKGEREIIKLNQQRNKALKDADTALRLAQAKENTKDAKAKRAKARGTTESFLRRQGSKAGQSLLSGLSQGAGSLSKDLRKKVGDAYKPKRRKKRKSTKRS